MVFNEVVQDLILLSGQPNVLRVVMVSENKTISSFWLNELCILPLSIKPTQIHTPHSIRETIGKPSCNFIQPKTSHSVAEFGELQLICSLYVMHFKMLAQPQPSVRSAELPDKGLFASTSAHAYLSESLWSRTKSSSHQTESAGQDDASLNNKLSPYVWYIHFDLAKTLAYARNMLSKFALTDFSDMSVKRYT